MTRPKAPIFIGIAGAALLIMLGLLFWWEPWVPARTEAGEEEEKATVEPAPPLDERALSEADLAFLNKLAKGWVKAHVDYETDDSEENIRTLRSARQTFFREVDARCDRDDVLRDMRALSVIFEHAFPYEQRQRTRGLRLNQEPMKHHVFVPPAYDCDNAFASVVVLRGREEDTGDWAEAKDYFAATWKHARAASDTIFVLPQMDTGDFDVMPDLRNELWRNAESLSIRRVLFPYGEVQRQFRLDRSRRFLDCGAGTCGFGLRLVTYFPGLFAGVILRHPVDPGDLQLGGLNNPAILLIQTNETRAACDRIQQALDPTGESRRVTVVSVRGDAPYPGATHAIDAWVRRHSRPSFPTQVFLPITDDRFGRAFWITVLHHGPLAAVAKEDRPWLHARVDRERNRIVIKSRNVQRVCVYLNDAMVDLDKPVVFEINGKETRSKKRRRFDTLFNEMMREFDATFLYPAYCHVDIPTGDGRKETGQRKRGR